MEKCGVKQDSWASSRVPEAQVHAIVIEGNPAAMEARFADQQPADIDARICFVALVLAAGQRLASGNAMLFVAARDAFDWDGGRRRPWQGQAERFIDQAFEERWRWRRRQDDAPKTE